MNETAEFVVYGAGGHGKVVADLALARGLNLLGFVDDGTPAGSIILEADGGWPYGVLGTSDWLSRQESRLRVLLAIGDNQARRRVSVWCDARTLEIVTLVHPSAIVSVYASIGRGSVVMAGAVLNPAARVGEGCIINTGAVIEHDVTIGDFAHVSPNATLAGGAGAGALCHIGSGAVVLPGIKVGQCSIVGAGAVVHRDVPEGVVVAGVPSRMLRRLP